MEPSLALATPDSAIRRLSSLAVLDATEKAALHESIRARYSVAPLREFVSERERVVEPTILLSGWACRVRYFSDGRRQILGLLLPGELMGLCHQRDPLAATTIMALTPISLCPAPRTERSGAGLADAYAASGALEEAFLFRHIARLGRMSAYDRLIDWLLEVRDRLALAGLASDDCFAVPLTQEGMADMLGLTSVHVNRTLQVIRRDGLIELRGGNVRLVDLPRLYKLVDYRPVIVSRAEPIAVG